MTTDAREKQVLCDMCGKTYIRVYSFYDHETVHSAELPHSCIDCGNSFHCLAALRRHKKAHTGKHVYTCTECGKSFYQNLNLKQHMTAHMKEKFFLCQECGKCFDQRWSLIVHQSTHTGECSFSCTKYENSFRANCNLSRHQKIFHTAGTVVPGPKCQKRCIEARDLPNNQKTPLEMKLLLCNQNPEGVLHGTDATTLETSKEQPHPSIIKCGNGLSISTATAVYVEAGLPKKHDPCTKQELLLKLASYIKRYTEKKLRLAGHQEKHVTDVHTNHAVQADSLAVIDIDALPLDQFQQETLSEPFLQETPTAQVHYLAQVRRRLQQDL